jgi:hypothetical protein
MPGQTANVKLRAGSRKFGRAVIAGKAAPGLLDGGVRVSFPGEPVEKQWHRKLSDLKPVPVPEDAEQLYEATCFSAPNDALEVQSLRRSGPSQIPQVIAARKAFFEQELFWRRGIWDKYLFDGNDESFLGVYHYRRDQRLSGGCLRLDLGEVCEADTIRIKTIREENGEAEPPTEMAAEVTSDLKSWRPVVFRRKMQDKNEKVKVAWIENNGGKHHYIDLDLLRWEAQAASVSAFRYLSLAPAPQRTAEVEIIRGGVRVEPADSQRRATVLFSPYDKARAELAWQATVSIAPNPAPKSYLCVALNGEHGKNGALVALRTSDGWIGATQRAVSFPAVVFEYGPSNRGANYTYFFPITPEMRGKKLDVVVLGQAGCKPELKPEVWTTVYPNPYTSVEVLLD